jgi:hypothetical protein
MESIGLVVVCALALAFIIFPARAMLQGAASVHWRQVRGTVRRVAIEHTTERGELDSFSARLDFEYVFEGAPHHKRLFLGASTNERAQAVLNGSAYTAGQQIDVFVDPAKPARCTLVPGVDYKNLVPIGTAIYLLLVLLFILYKTSRL